MVLQLAYHTARLLSYAAVGALFGLLGAAFDLGGALLGLHRTAAFLAGGMMVVVSITIALSSAGWRPPQLSSSYLRRLMLFGNRLAAGWAPLPRAATIGVLTACLPCGWLYAFALIAAGTGHVLSGMSVMIAFWLGTVPVLAALGVGVQTLVGTVGRRLPLVTALLLVALGLYTVFGRFSLSARSLEQLHPLPAAGSAPQHVSDTSQKLPPCCQPQ
jgi:sulfite exporter TauE/SafE